VPPKTSLPSPLPLRVGINLVHLVPSTPYPDDHLPPPHSSEEMKMTRSRERLIRSPSHESADEVDLSLSYSSASFKSPSPFKSPAIFSHLLTLTSPSFHKLLLSYWVCISCFQAAGISAIRRPHLLCLYHGPPTPFEVC